VRPFRSLRRKPTAHRLERGHYRLGVTFIATVATPHYTLQVSDRLLTAPAGPFDALANKALILGTRRGVVSVAFSGTAFVKGRSTDQRIAEQVTGTPLDQDATTFTDAAVAPSIGHVIHTLVEYFYDSRAWRQYQSEFVMTGWQWKIRQGAMRNYRPVLYSVKTIGRIGSIKLWQHVPRHWPERRGVALNISGIDPFTSAERKTYTARLAPQLPAPEEAEAVLVEMLREAARRNDGIGQDGMSILLPASAPWRPRVNYVSVTEPTLTWVKSGQRVPIRYTPWVVHGGVAAGTRIVMGVKSMTVGKLQVQVNCPPVRARGDMPNSFIPVAHQGLHRPRPGGHPEHGGGLPPQERLFSE
jgi:hypothetical protein